MAYVAWSVVFGEQPSAAKWNILGANDASFNNGTGIGSAVITSSKIDFTTFPYAHALWVKSGDQTSSAVAFTEEIVTMPNSFALSSANAASFFTTTASNQINIALAGKYKLSLNMSAEAANAAPKIYKNAVFAKSFGYMHGGDHTTASFVHTMSLALNDKLTIVCDSAAGTSQKYYGTYTALLIEKILD